jgi:hypothetical protein
MGRDARSDRSRGGPLRSLGNRETEPFGEAGVAPVIHVQPIRRYESSVCDSVLGTGLTNAQERQTQQRSKELTRLSRAEFTRDQADTLAVADRNHEIVELPPGLENGQTRKRMRALVLTATASTRFARS